jgi:hypothetical protein
MLRNISYFMLAGGLVGTRPLAAQTSPPDTVRRIATLAGTISRFGAAVGGAIWPGYHPESIPTLYVIPGRAKVFVAWRDTLPRGFAPMPGVPNTAWTDTQTVSFPSGRFIAFLAVDSAATPGDVLGLALHEEFHSFEHMLRRPGHRFGDGENALLVGRYPVFDIDNETLFAIEGRLLRRAFEARSGAATRELACRFLAVRARRQQGLDSAFATFERMAEMNEGLAQYALLRGETELGWFAGGRFVADARAAVTAETALLDSLLTLSARSVRRRFYATGSTIALLLDRLAGPAWKRDMVKHDRTVQEALGLAAGCPGVARAGRAWADSLEQSIHVTRPEAERAVAALRARRREQADSVLAQPGRRIALLAASLPGRRFQYCGFDPQNLLQGGDGQTLHMRFVVLCAGDGLSITIERGAIEDSTGTVRTVLDASTPITVTAGGRPVTTLPDSGSIDLLAPHIEAAGFTLDAPRATLAIVGGELRITPRP